MLVNVSYCVLLAVPIFGQNYAQIIQFSPNYAFFSENYSFCKISQKSPENVAYSLLMEHFMLAIIYLFFLGQSVCHAHIYFNDCRAERNYLILYYETMRTYMRPHMHMSLCLMYTLLLIIFSCSLSARVIL